MNVKSVVRQSIEGRLRHALERNEFLLHYQPKVDLESGQISGVEALIRWRQPDGHLVPPSEFVPIAEECGMMVLICRWVLREACRQARIWQDAGLFFKRVSVNFYAPEFRAEGFIAGVRDALNDSGLAARYLDIELTEGVLMSDPESAVAIFQELKAMGIHVAVDDFGTGYSSLSYLSQFPIDVLKIDQSSVQQISGNPHDAAIVSAIIDLGKNLEQSVIAEGIETPEQLAFLKSRHCPEGQGYLFSQPLDAAQFAIVGQFEIAA